MNILIYLLNLNLNNHYFILLLLSLLKKIIFLYKKNRNNVEKILRIRTQKQHLKIPISQIQFQIPRL